MFTLHNGDCLQVMPSIPSGSIDAIITDLPYGTTACKWDTVIEFAPMWKEVKRVLKPNGAFITTASQPFTTVLIQSNFDNFKYSMVWVKDRPNGIGNANKMPMRYHEDIVVFYEKLPPYNKQFIKRSEGGLNRVKYKVQSGFKETDTNNHKFGLKEISIKYGDEKILGSVIEVKKDSPSVLKHATQKPVLLFEYLVNMFTNEGETVLDIAMGSGTTIEAAERTGRNSIGIEKDEGIFQSAVLRLKPFTPSNNRLQPTAFGVGTQAEFPLLGGTQADESPAINGGG